MTYFTKQVTQPKLSHRGIHCPVPASKPLTLVNKNFAVEVIDYAVMQLFYTYPSNDVTGAGQEQGCGRKLDAGLAKIRSDSVYTDVEGCLCPSSNRSRGGAEAQQLDIHMANKTIRLRCDFKYM